jgi:hypothetical protein
VPISSVRALARGVFDLLALGDAILVAYLVAGYGCCEHGYARACTGP